VSRVPLLTAGTQSVAPGHSRAYVVRGASTEEGLTARIETFEIDAPSGATINLLGDVTFGYKVRCRHLTQRAVIDHGPSTGVGRPAHGREGHVRHLCAPALFPTPTSLTCPRAVNGNGHQLLGQGDQYWDGQGGSGGKTKPAPLLRINHSGTFKNVVVKNSPMRAVAVGGASIVVDGVTVDNCAWRGRGVDRDGERLRGVDSGRGYEGRAQHRWVRCLLRWSGHDPELEGPRAGSVRSSFDAERDSYVRVCADDCLAINRGTGITFKNNVCTGPTHGISIGSINSNTVVKTVRPTLPLRVGIAPHAPRRS
jgi:hypothetical protein